MFGLRFLSSEQWDSKQCDSPVVGARAARSPAEDLCGARGWSSRFSVREDSRRLPLLTYSANAKGIGQPLAGRHHFGTGVSVRIGFAHAEA